MMQSTDLGQLDDLAELGSLDRADVGSIHVERAMRPATVVMAEVPAQGPTEMVLGKRSPALYHSVAALTESE